MLGALVSILLLSSLVIAYIATRECPVPAVRPLDVDSGLPFPAFGQASTVFSLTAWFGAYFAIFLVLGVPAIAGIGVGTVIALFFVRHWVKISRASSFENFVSFLLLGQDNSHVTWLSVIISIMWIGFAASEIIILKEVVQAILYLRSDQALLISIGSSIIAYFYLLIGGYAALYRTDVIQFIFVFLMTVILSGIVLLKLSSISEINVLLPRIGYWNFPVVWKFGSESIYIYHFFIGAIMGLAFMLSSPDTWKRVFIVTQNSRKSSYDFLIFVIVGMLPFIMLIPFIISLPNIHDGPIHVKDILSMFPVNNMFRAVLILGLISCFLSSFDSALLAAVHIMLLETRRMYRGTNEVTTYYILMGSALLFILIAVSCFISFVNNPYMLANFLLGVFALVAGLLAGAAGKFEQLPRKFLISTLGMVLIIWTAYFLQSMSEQSSPTTYQVNTIPFGVTLACVTAIVSRILLRFRRH